MYRLVISLNDPLDYTSQWVRINLHELQSLWVCLLIRLNNEVQIRENVSQLLNLNGFWKHQIHSWNFGFVYIGLLAMASNCDNGWLLDTVSF